MVEIIKMTENELSDCTEIWNSIVEDGNSFPQLEVLDLAAARDFSAVNPTPERQILLKKAKLREYTYFIRIMSEDADISAMQAMP